MPLRIGLDLRGLDPGFKAHFGRGTGRYVAELSRVLLPQDHSDLEITPLNAEMLGAGKFATLFRDLFPLGRTTIEQQFLLPRRVAKSGIDAVHFFAHGDSPARLKVPSIVTVLDLIPLKFAELYKADRPSWRFHLARRLELEAIRNAHGIIVISEATKRDCQELLGIPASRLYVTHLAIDERFLRQPKFDRSSYRAAHRLPENVPVFLSVGGIDPRKNMHFLLEVFAKFLSYRPDALLLLAGRFESDRHYPALVQRVRELGIERAVRMHGFVPDDELTSLYGAADALVFPSLYEGFGLPVLEAMAVGLPVIAGKNSSIPELVGGVFPLVADNDQDGWVSRMEEALRERDSQTIQVAKQRASEFTWEKTAQATLNAYRTILKTLS